MNRNYNFEKNIRNKLRGYNPNPPSDVWDQVEANLHSKKRKHWKGYVKYAAMVAILIISAWAVYDFVLLDKTSQQYAIEESTKITPKVESSIKKEHPAQIEKDIKDKQALNKEFKIAEHIKETEKKHKILDDDDEIDKSYQTSFEKTEIQKEKGYQYAEFKTKKEALKLDTRAPERLNVDLSENIELANIVKKTVAESKEYYSLSDLAYSDEFVYYEEDEKRWSFSANLSPQYSFRINSSNPEELVRAKTIFEQNEEHLINYNFGLNVKYNLNDRFEIESGINYVRMGQSIRNIIAYTYESPYGQPLHDGQSAMTSMGLIIFNDPSLYFVDNSSERVKMRGEPVDTDDVLLETQSDRLNQHLGFINTPIVARYCIYDRNSKIQIKGGLGFNFMVLNNVVLHKDDIKNSIGHTSLMRNWNVSLSAGTALIVPLGKNINFHLEPTANLFVTSLSQGRSYNVYPFGISVNAGLSMPF